MIKSVSIEAQVLGVLLIVMQLVQGTIVLVRTSDTPTQGDLAVLDTKIEGLKVADTSATAAREAADQIIKELSKAVHSIEISLERIRVTLERNGN